MRSSSPRFSLVELAGWMFIAASFWLLVSTHSCQAHPAALDAGLVAGPATVHQEASLLIGLNALRALGTDGAGRRAHRVSRERHLAFWQARTQLRPVARKRAGVLGFLLPKRSAHTLCDEQRQNHCRGAECPPYRRMHRPAMFNRRNRG